MPVLMHVVGLTLFIIESANKRLKLKIQVSNIDSLTMADFPLAAGLVYLQSLPELLHADLDLSSCWWMKECWMDEGA